MANRVVSALGSPPTSSASRSGKSSRSTLPNALTNLVVSNANAGADSELPTPIVWRDYLHIFLSSQALLDRLLARYPLFPSRYLECYPLAQAMELKLLTDFVTRLSRVNGRTVRAGDIADFRRAVAHFQDVRIDVSSLHTRVEDLADLVEAVSGWDS